jgi:hypothetical protein
MRHRNRKRGRGVKLRRAIRVGLPSLLLGAATTYGVAWTIMNRCDLSARFSDPSHNIYRDDWWGTCTRTMGAVWVLAWPGGFTRERGQEPAEELVQHAPKWSIAEHQSPDDIARANGIAVSITSRSIGAVSERAAGWPFLAVVERRCAVDGRLVAAKGADLSIRWPRGAATRVWQGTTLAFLPIWTGFVLDVALYGTLWAATILSLTRLIRGRRARTGQCTVCRYDLTGITTGICPECGSPIKTESPA